MVAEDREGNIWVPTFGGGLNKLDAKTGKFKHYVEKNGLPNNVVYGVLIDEKGFVWLSTNKGLSRFDPVSETFRSYTSHDGLQSNEFNYGAYFLAKNGEMFFGGLNGLNYFFPDQIKENPYIPKVVFTNFKIANKEVVISDTSVLSKHISVTEEIELFYRERDFTVEFASLHYSLPENNRYAFMLEGFDSDWTITSANEVKYTNLDEGVYTLKVKGSNSDGVWNEKPIALKIIIHPPFYKQRSVIVIAIFVFLGSVFALYRIRVRRAERNNRILEQKVRESTQELRREKEKAEQANELMQEANKKITDSIRYALRIQEAIIPSAEEVREIFEDSFVLFKPRDIVSGDFYWCSEIDGYKFVAVLDCTGHGVPGAFMSVIGFSLLEQIIKVQKIYDPGKILDVMDEDVVHWLRQDKDTMSGTAKRRDGMDMVLVRIAPDNKTTFSGAKNSVFVAHNGVVQEYKGEKFSIGGLLLHADKKEFHTFDLPCEKGDYIYLSSDGYFDQFGGEQGRKFTKRRFTEVLRKNAHLSGVQQCALLEEIFTQWRGKNNQIDDLLVLGLRV
jgi:serine phosphatase RsbU (regulator of sigma subunit)